MPDYLMSEADALKHIDRVLAEKFPDLYRAPEQPADSFEKIAADFPWLFGNAKAKE